MPPSYYLGLDLGQAQQFTALAVLEHPACQPGAVGSPAPAVYRVRHLQRFDLGTSYPRIFDVLTERTAVPPLQNASLIVDQTGVGRAVVELLRRRTLPVCLVPVVIGGGTAISHGDDGSVHLPRQELAGVLQVLLQTRRLQVAASLPEAAVLVAGLDRFRLKAATPDSDSFEGWRDGQHDDLVLAAWSAERWRPWAVPTCLPAPASSRWSWQERVARVRRLGPG